MHLTYVTTVTLRFLTLWLQMQSGHGFLKPVNWIIVKFINGNYNKNNITNIPVRPFQATITINCKISRKWQREDTWRRSWWWPCLRGRTPSFYLSSTSVCLFLFGKVRFPMSRVSHASSIFQHPMLTSSPPQPSPIANVTPQDTWGPSATSPLPHNKPGAHALTWKTYIANQNNICPTPAQEDIIDSSISSTPEPYRAHHVKCPKFHHAQTISTMS
jgi:hypothetical protein